MKTLLLLALLLIATAPANAVRIFGLGRPSKWQRGYVRVATAHGPKWVRKNCEHHLGRPLNKSVKF